MRCSSSVKTEFPDITISKIRFLESEGLIEPERTPSGYRKFYEKDVERLRSILRMQRDEYLPLKVIKERLLAGRRVGRPRAADGGRERHPSPARARRRARRGAHGSADVHRGDERPPPAIDRERIRELESFGLVKLARARRRELLRWRRLHRALDREGLLPLRRRAPAPHDVPALRRARGRLLRVDRDAPAPSAEPRRPPGARPDRSPSSPRASRKLKQALLRNQPAPALT